MFSPCLVFLLYSSVCWFSSPGSPSGSTPKPPRLAFHSEWQPCSPWPRPSLASILNFPLCLIRKVGILTTRSPTLTLHSAFHSIWHLFSHRCVDGCLHHIHLFRSFGICICVSFSYSSCLLLQSRNVCICWFQSRNVLICLVFLQLLTIKNN